MRVIIDLIVKLLKLIVLLILAATALGFGLCGVVGLPQAIDGDGINGSIVLLSLFGFGIMWLAINRFRALAKRFFPTRAVGGWKDDSRR
jgi:hypothetical protein